jgi:5-methylcytosine-specific restriction endonuclease McrA
VGRPLLTAEFNASNGASAADRITMAAMDDIQDEHLCENCGRPDTTLSSVHRVYVVPEAWDTPGSVTAMADVELWCWSCRSQYPHDEAGTAQ